MHECPTCFSACYCDGEDTRVEPDDLDCIHACDYEECILCQGLGCFECRCPTCDGAGCADCIADYQCCASYPDCLHVHPERGDRQAISEALVAPLFELKLQTKKENER